MLDMSSASYNECKTLSTPVSPQSYSTNGICNFLGLSMNVRRMRISSLFMKLFRLIMLSINAWPFQNTQNKKMKTRHLHKTRVMMQRGRMTNKRKLHQRLMAVCCQHRKLVGANLKWGLMFCKFDRRWGLQEYKTKYMHVEYRVVQ